jgi:hypothetical protein
VKRGVRRLARGTRRRAPAARHPAPDVERPPPEIGELEIPGGAVELDQERGGGEQCGGASSRSWAARSTRSGLCIAGNQGYCVPCPGINWGRRI